jgi:lysozyme
MISPEALALIKYFEGFRSKPYLCSASVPTIGYGSTFYKDGTKVTLNDKAIDIDTGNDLFNHSLSSIFIPSVLRLCPVLVNHPNKLGAIISFTYNLGAGNLRVSTLRQKINQEKWDEAADQLLRWNMAGGKVSNGLKRRREAERVLFLS